MKRALHKLAAGLALSATESEEVFCSFLTQDRCDDESRGAGGEGRSRESASDAQIGALLFALAVRQPTVDELVGAVCALRAQMRRVSVPSGAKVVDTCGTGGSGLNAFNTSTVAALICAASGLTVAKHGNRAITSSCGSADLLEELGVTLAGDPQRAADLLSKTGFAFLFAPLFHPATKRAQAIRCELGFRTIFNIIGPLVNPAQPACQVIGVGASAFVPLVAETLRRLGTHAALVVSGDDGLDELTLTGGSSGALLRDGVVSDFRTTPEELGLKRVSPREIEGFSPQESAKKVHEILDGISSPHADLVALNAGAMLWIAGTCADLCEGISSARELLKGGGVKAKLAEIVASSGEGR